MTLKRQLISAVVIFCAGMIRGHAEESGSYTNSLEIVMVRIPAGKFQMGSELPTDPEELKQSPVLAKGDYDEKPSHEVSITRSFYMSETEITAKQFSRFRDDYQDWGPSSPYATGISWEESVAFCRWLSATEKRNYRLPTEAEWEYACRAGSQNHFSSGNLPPGSGEPNAWGLKNMHTDAAEWVLDWHDLYPEVAQVDPVGPRDGYARVVRGGGLSGPQMGNSRKYPNDGRLPYFRRSANRASMAQGFRGRHNIGFRIVEGPLPASFPSENGKKLANQFVKQTNRHLKMGPAADHPWFRQRSILPIPPQNAREEEILAAGLPPSMLGFNHNPALAVCPNGDLLVSYFSASVPNYEDLANVCVIAVRLRFGSESWDMPSAFFDLADIKDIAPILWTEGQTIYNVTGGGGLSDMPFRLQTSPDSGATWTAVRVPLVSGPLGPSFPQPISGLFRGSDQTIYLPSDGVGGTSMLWESRDNGHTWSDAGGRTGGRHTVFVTLKDGSMLGMGGKASDIDGYMPKSVSRDGGRTWTVTKTQFPAVGKSQQKPTLLRLASGRLFFAADWQNAEGKQPPGVTTRGSYVALSGDEGETWKIKTLTSALPHDRHVLRHRPDWGVASPLQEGTLGYSISAQSPNGLIHLVSCCNHPSQHFEMNEAWILSDISEQTPALPNGRLLTDSEDFTSGSPKASWSGRSDATGRYLLDGVETWQYPSGSTEYQVTWKDGVKAGTETYWNKESQKVWTWDHSPSRTSVWTKYWPDGKKKHESRWHAGRCTGTATSWNSDSSIAMQHQFKDGEMIE